MKDHELEDLLRRYRPAAPAPALRGRLLGAELVPAARAWPWAVAAAALLALVTGLHLSTDRVYRRLAVAEPPADVSDIDQIPALRSAVDDDDALRRMVMGFARLEREERSAIPPDTPWQ